jgi:hypothetical protein
MAFVFFYYRVDVTLRGFEGLITLALYISFSINILLN